MKIFATGDSFIIDYYKDYYGLNEIKELLTSGDFNFTNLEVNLFDKELPAGPVSGGTWSKSKEKALKTLIDTGFNMYNTANNHSLDYLHAGLLNTTKVLTDYGLCFAGTGATLREASKASYVNNNGYRAALVAAVTTAPTDWIGSDQKVDMPGRPGVNLIRLNAKHYVNEEAYKALEIISDNTEINQERNLLIAEGFLTKDSDSFTLGELKFVKGDEFRTEYELELKDMNRLKDSLDEAKYQSDLVIFSIHGHEYTDGSKAIPARPIEEIARFAIDNGADIVLGHGPHIVRGLEIYKNKPIFYSLGNFIFQNDLVEYQPPEFYDRYSVKLENRVSDAYLARSSRGKKGLGINPSVWSSIIAEITFNDDTFELENIVIHPITLGFDKTLSRKGIPKIEKELNLAQRELIELSKMYDTEFREDSNLLYLDLE